MQGYRMLTPSKDIPALVSKFGTLQIKPGHWYQKAQEYFRCQRLPRI